MNSSTKTEQELWKVIWDLEQRIKKLETLVLNLQKPNYQYTEHQIRMHSGGNFCQVHDCPYCMGIAKNLQKVK